jgi:hypothetical protein
MNFKENGDFHGCATLLKSQQILESCHQRMETRLVWLYTYEKKQTSIPIKVCLLAFWYFNWDAEDISSDVSNCYQWLSTFIFVGIVPQSL